jgi:nucleotide-binding universal stress UspA family protein
MAAEARDMYRTILLAYDGSESGREALHQGAELARLCGAKTVLLAVLAPGVGMLLAEAAGPTDLPERELVEVERVLLAGAQELRRSGLTVETQVRMGSPAAEIGSVAREISADLIVVGHRGLGTLARWWSGSTGASLLAHAPCSMLIAMAAPGGRLADTPGGAATTGERQKGGPEDR